MPPGRSMPPWHLTRAVGSARLVRLRTADSEERRQWPCTVLWVAGTPVRLAPEVVAFVIAVIVTDAAAAASVFVSLWRSEFKTPA